MDSSLPLEPLLGQLHRHSAAVHQAFLYAKELLLSSVDAWRPLSTLRNVVVSVQDRGPAFRERILRGVAEYRGSLTTRDFQSIVEWPGARETWDPAYSGGTVVQVLSDQCTLSHSTMKGWWPVSSRDLCVVLTTVHTPSYNQILCFATSVEDPLVPVKGWGSIRAQCPIALFFLEQLASNHVRITYLAQSDPGGSLPERALSILAQMVPLCVASVIDYGSKYGSPPRVDAVRLVSSSSLQLASEAQIVTDRTYQHDSQTVRIAFQLDSTLRLEPSALEFHVRIDMQHWCNFQEFQGFAVQILNSSGQAFSLPCTVRFNGEKSLLLLSLDLAHAPSPCKGTVELTRMPGSRSSHNLLSVSVNGNAAAVTTEKQKPPKLSPALAPAPATSSSAPSATTSTRGPSTSMASSLESIPDPAAEASLEYYTSDLRRSIEYLHYIHALPSSKWTPIPTAENRLRIFQHSIEGHPVGMLKAVVTLPVDGLSPTPLDLRAIIENSGARQVWDKLFHESDFLDFRIPLSSSSLSSASCHGHPGRLVYTKMNGKWPTAPRDIVGVISAPLQQSESRYSSVITSLSEEMNLETLPSQLQHIPQLNKKLHNPTSHVRAYLELAGWIVERSADDKELVITYYVQSDPKGWIPSSVLSLVKTQIPTSALHVVEYWQTHGAPPLLLDIYSVPEDATQQLRILASDYNHSKQTWKLQYQRIDASHGAVTLRVRVRVDTRKWANDACVAMELVSGGLAMPVSSAYFEECKGAATIVFEHSLLVSTTVTTLLLSKSTGNAGFRLNGKAIQPQSLQMATPVEPQLPSAPSPSDPPPIPSSPSTCVAGDPTQQSFLPTSFISPHTTAAHDALRRFLELSSSSQWFPISGSARTFSNTFRYTGTHHDALQFPIIKSVQLIHAFAPEEVFAAASGCLGCREHWDSTGFRKGTLVEDLGNGLGIYHAELRKLAWPVQARDMLWVEMTKRTRSTFPITEVSTTDGNAELGSVFRSTVTHQLGAKIYSIGTSIEDDLFPPASSVTRMSWLTCAWIFEPIYLSDRSTTRVYSSSLHIPGTKVTLIGQLDLKGVLPTGINILFATNEIPRMLENLSQYLEKYGPPPSVRIPIDVTAPTDSTHIDWELEEKSPAVEICSTDYNHATMEYRLRFRILRAPELFLSPLLLDENSGRMVSGSDTERTGPTPAQYHYHLLDISVDLKRLTQGYEINVDSPNCTVLSALLDIRVTRAATISIVPVAETNRYTHNRRLRHHIGLYMQPSMLEAILGETVTERTLSELYPIEVELVISAKHTESLTSPRSSLLPFFAPSTSPLSSEEMRSPSTAFSPTLEDNHDVPVVINGQSVRIQSTGHIRYLRRTYQSGSRSYSEGMRPRSAFASAPGISGSGGQLFSPKRVSFAMDQSERKLQSEGMSRVVEQSKSKEKCEDRNQKWRWNWECVAAVVLALVSFLCGLGMKATALELMMKQ